MSTGLECNFYETKGQWFYLLQDWSCPVQCWDWREYATAYGPFRSKDEAYQHLHDHHANPGGSTTVELGDEPLDEVLSAAFAEAQARGTRRSAWSF